VIITDVVAQPVKTLALSVEPGQTVYSVRLKPPDARSLGLREGQIVNAVIENKADGNVLLLNKNIALKLPLQIPIPGEVAAKIRMDSLTHGILSLIVSKKPETAEKASPASYARLARLISKGSSLGSLEKLLKQDFSRSEGGQDLRTSLVPFSLQGSWFKRYDFKTIYPSLLASGLFHEKDLLEGAVQPNLKEILLRLLKSSKVNGPEASLIFSAIEDIESNQIESLAQQLSRTTQYQWLVPVLGDWPIELQFFGDSEGDSKDDEEIAYRWKIVIKVKVNELESIDLSALFTETEAFSLYVAMPNEDLLHLGTTRKDWLLSEIQKLGIRIDEFKIFQKGCSTTPNKYAVYGVSTREKSWIADA
jgi:hypothetical protein